MTPWIVIDACVAGAWSYAETYSSQAQNVLTAIEQRRVTALCPDRFVEEILRICQKKMLPPPIGEGVTAREAFERFLDVVTLPFDFMSSDEIYERAWDIAIGNGLTTHDALYVALAERWGAELWTLDAAVAGVSKAQFPQVHDLRVEIFPY